MDIKENIPLKPFTVFQVGGPARFFIEAGSKEEVIAALKWAREKKVPFFILGLGSNILVSDRGFPGLVIKISGGRMSREGDLITVEAGVKMAEVVNFSLRQGLVGFEWAIGVPGTIGGSVRGNAGCFGSEMKDVVEKVEVFDADSASSYKLNSRDCRFSYRHSVFKERPELVVLAAALRLKPGNVAAARKRLAEFSKARLAPKEQASGRIGSQEIGVPTAGSTFKNMPWSRRGVDKNYLMGKFPEFRAFAKNRDLPAGFLIDLANLKGVKVGGVSVSEKHANFIINAGGATAEDIVMLIGLIKERIHRKFGIQLEEEIQYVGF